MSMHAYICGYMYIHKEWICVYVPVYKMEEIFIKMFNYNSRTKLVICFLFRVFWNHLFSKFGNAISYLVES